uniref:Uncharacterized protein n=1 Tax=Solanum tuberosum TaxID=4113 RepID=M1DRT9_SOLTU
MDSPTSMNVNALMSDSIDMDEKFAMMDQPIEASKNSIDDKNLHIAQLMNKLETFTLRESSHVPTCPPDAKFYLDFGRSNIEEPTQPDSIGLVDSKVQWATIKMSKNRIEEISIKLSLSKGDIQSNIDNEKPIFRYIPCERRKKGQPLPKECTQQVHPPRKELCHTTFQDLKEKMIFPVAQVPSIPLDPSKGNTQFGKIKGNFHQKVFTLFEKSSYNFSNPTMLGELRDEVIDGKIDCLTKSQMWLRKKGYYVATPRFGLGFSLPEPFWI